MNRSGQALIEVLVAISVLVVGFLGIISLLSRSLSLNRVVADNYTATYLAAEGVEVIKNILDSESMSHTAWGSAFSGGGSFEVTYATTAANLSRIALPRALHFDSSPGAKHYDYNDTNPTTHFNRVVKVETISPDQVRVTSRVDWTTRGGGSFSTELTDNFYNWRGYAESVSNTP